MEKTPCWHKILYLVNIITFILGCALSIVCIMTLKDKYVSFALPDWALKMGAAIGFVVAFLSLTGIWGTFNNRSKKEEESCNLCLWIYLVAVTIGLVLAIVVAVMITVESGKLKDAKAVKYTASGQEAVEKRITDYIDGNIKKNGTVWKDVQKHFKCCGWESFNNTSPRATGPTCFNPPACRDKVLDYAKDKAITLSVAGFLFTFILLLCSLSACWILCCFNYDKHNMEDVELGGRQNVKFVH